MIKITDNYLMPYEYDMIRAYFEGDMDNGTVDGSCNWNFVNGCSQIGDGHFHFSSLIHSMFEVRVPRAYELLKPLIERTNMSSIARIKANCVLKTSELLVFTNGFHDDYPPESNLITGIYYINTNDGYTLFEDGTRCDSVANRFCMFPSGMKHTGTTCSDTDRRILINFNFTTYDKHF